MPRTQPLHGRYSWGQNLPHFVSNDISTYFRNCSSSSRCSSWRTTAGMPFTAMSTCQPDGSWSSPVHFPRGILERPHVLETPDMGDMPCAPAPIPTASCKPLNITYDPNEEDGAGFYCTPPLDWANLPVKMSKPTVCYLLCNMMLVATVQCREGVWTGHPEIGFWCNQKNAPVDFWKEPMKTKSWKYGLNEDIISILSSMVW